MEQGETVLTALDEAKRSAATLDERAAAVLEIGVNELDADVGFLTRIDPEAGRWQAAVSTGKVSTDELTQDLEQTYCRRTIETGRLAVANAEREGWETDPAFTEGGHASYLGVAIGGDRTPGTVCFLRTEPRDSAFSAEELLLAELIANQLERDRYRDEANRQLEHLEAFVSMISHDLRNPLTVARGWVEAEQADSESDALDRAIQALGRLEGLIENGVQLARAAQPVTETEPVTLSSTAERAWHGGSLGDGTIEFEGDLEFMADPTRLRPVFEHLFQNAVEYGGNTVTVRVGPLPSGPGFYVADDGPGIDVDIRDRVFEQGFSGEGSGEGFGLALVKATIEAHGWKIALVESTAGGARFEISDVVTTA